MANSIDIRQENPPAITYGSRQRVSKYNEAIKLALENKHTWFRVASTPVENRNSMYSTASAIRDGRLGDVPTGEKVQVMCRRVEDEIVLFIQGL